MGESHLIKILQKQRYLKILDTVSLTERQKNELREGLYIKSGKAALTINTILSSTLGAWMGLYDFLNSTQESRIELFAILIFAVIICSLIGYISFHSSNEENSKNIRAQKINNLKICCGKIILKKRKLLVFYSINKCNMILEDFYKNNNWESGMCLYLKANSTNNDRQVIKNLLCNYIKKQIPVFEMVRHYTLCAYTKKNEKKTHEKSDQCFRALTKAPQGDTKSSDQFFSWAQKNKKNILITFLPVLFGAFASSFVYLVGVPHIVEQYNILAIDNALKTKTIKWLSLTVILCITIYFSYISVHSIYRSYKRNVRLTKSEKKFSRIETEIIQITRSTSSLKKLFSELDSLFLINQIIRKDHLNIDK